ncbi:MAG TPA: NAD(P)/FAD-dependent oxidoreductase [Ktedonobacterales bacterium]|jgi:L-2-hydroxyglutarate oxidase LhgO|nr:NAD(P)/FAD-dependent oxidoreductase [Ktedonobacterales bacterium]
MADDFSVDVVVIGAGVVGLAIAARLSASGREVVVVEKNDSFGRETSSRNSEVIHAGLQYPLGSLKARFSVRGNRMLYDICGRHGVPHRNTGKLVIAVEEDETAGLDDLKATAERNGVEGLRVIGRAEVERLEPHISAPAALYVPSTGIVDAHSLMTFFAQSAREHGADLVYRSTVRGIERLTDGYRVIGADASGESFALRASVVVNAAGLWADAIAALVGIDIDAAGYRQHFAKGDYFSIAPARTGLVSRLVYPVAATGAERAGTRIHLTIDLSGRMRLGPDAVWLPDSWRDNPTYQVDESRRDVFWQSARRYLPWLELSDIAPDGAGVRPRVFGPGQPQPDFIIRHETERGLPGFVNLVGIESPGLTSSPAIAEYVAELLG